MLPVSAMAADGTIDYGGVTLYTEKRPAHYTFLRSNEANAVTENVGETGIYQRLPRETCVHTRCGTVLAEFIPDHYSASTTTVELSDPTVLKDLGYTISGWNGNDEYKDKPCLTFNYTAAKPGTTTVKLTFYYNYNHAGASGYCNGCGGLTGYNDNFVWWQETTSFTVTVGDGENALVAIIISRGAAENLGTFKLLLADVVQCVVHTAKLEAKLFFIIDVTAVTAATAGIVRAVRLNALRRWGDKPLAARVYGCRRDLDELYFPLLAGYRAGDEHGSSADTADSAAVR